MHNNQDLQWAKAIEGPTLDFFQTQRSSRITAHHPYHLLPHTLFQVTSQPTLAPKTYILEVLSQNIETEHVN